MDSFESIKTLIDEFAQDESDKLDIPFELNNKERSRIHEYVSELGLVSESISIKGSSNKKMCVYCKLDKLKSITKEDIEFFIRYTKLPIPINEPEYIEYYIDLFDKMYNSRELWTLFNEERHNYMTSPYINQIEKEILKYFELNDE